jgi:PAS domain-containing protein
VYQFSDTLALLLQATNTGVWEYNVTTGQEWLSDRFHDLLGYTYSDQKTNSLVPPLLLLTHPEDRPRLRNLFELHSHKNQTFGFPVRIRHADTTYRWFEATGQVLFNPSGKPVRVVGSFLPDSFRMQYLHELEHRHELLLETSRTARVGGWEYYLNEPYVRWTEAVYTICEIPVGTPITLEVAINRYTPESYQLLSEKIERGISHQEEYDLELQLVLPNDLLWVRAIGKPILDDAGQVIGLRGTFHDIDELKKQKIQLSQSLEVITEQNSRLLQFSHIVSHSLRSHNSNLQLMVDVIRITQCPVEKEKIIRYIEEIAADLSQALESLDQVLFTIQNPAAAPAGLLLNELSDGLRTFLLETYPDCQLEVEGTLPLPAGLAMNPQALESIILNLASALADGFATDTPLRLQLATLLAGTTPALRLTCQAEKGTASGRVGLASTLAAPAVPATRRDTTSRRIAQRLVESLGGRLEAGSTPEGTPYYTVLFDES